MFQVYFYGPLKVLVCDVTGAVVAVQDKISGADALVAGFSPAYILAARTSAVLAFESQFSEV